MNDFELGKSLRRAERYLQEEQFGKVLKIFQEVERLNRPEILSEILDRIGMCYEELGDLKLALKTYRRGQKESKRIEDKLWFWRRRVKVIGKELLQRNKLSLAAKVLRNALEKEPAFFEFYWHLAAIYFYQREYELNLATLDTFIDLEKDLKVKAVAFLGKGIACEAKGELDEAEKNYLESIKLNPTDPRPYAFLGFLYMEKGEDGKAFEVWEKAEKLGFQEPALLYNLINFSLSQEDWEKGREYLRKIIKIDPDQVKEILEIASSKEAYQVILEEIFQQREPKLEEGLLEVLEGEEINLVWLKELLAEKKARQIDFSQRKIKRGKKVRPREYWILELVERVLSKIEEVEEIRRIEAAKAKEKESLAASQEFEEWEDVALKAERRTKKRKTKRPTIRYEEEY